MEVDSWKPKEWVGIASEPSCKITIAHVWVVLLKGPTCLPYLLCLTLVPLCLTLPYPIYFALPLPHFIFALPYLTLPTLPLVMSANNQPT